MLVAVNRTSATATAAAAMTTGREPTRLDVDDMLTAQVKPQLNRPGLLGGSWPWKRRAPGTAAHRAGVGHVPVRACYGRRPAGRSMTPSQGFRTEAVIPSGAADAGCASRAPGLRERFGEAESNQGRTRSPSCPPAFAPVRRGSALLHALLHCARRGRPGVIRNGL